MAEESSASSISVGDLMATLTAPGHRYRDARRRLVGIPDVVPVLAEALHAAENARTFYRTASTLSAIGTDAAAEALSLYALERRRFPRLAINALVACKNPATVPALLQLLESGLMDQRRAAAFGLARIGTALAIAPLAARAASGPQRLKLEPWGRGPDELPPETHDAIRREAWEALRRMGRTGRLAHKVLAEPALSVAEHVHAICVLADAFAANSLSLFDPQRFLDREAQNSRSPVRVQANEAAQFLRARTTLLRPSEPAGAGVLLRAAADPGDEDSTVLLRGASPPEPESVKRGIPARRRSWWQMVLRALGRKR